MINTINFLINQNEYEIILYLIILKNIFTFIFSKIDTINFLSFSIFKIFLKIIVIILVKLIKKKDLIEFNYNLF